MAETFIEKRHKNKKGEETVIVYRTDADFVPTAVKDICEPFIQNYVIAKGDVDWLVAQYEEMEEAEAKKETRGRKQGLKYMQKKSFVSIRAAFVRKYFPEILIGDTAPSSPREDFLKRFKK